MLNVRFYTTFLCLHVARTDPQWWTVCLSVELFNTEWIQEPQKSCPNENQGRHSSVFYYVCENQSETEASCGRDQADRTEREEQVMDC